MINLNRIMEWFCKIFILFRTIIIFYTIPNKPLYSIWKKKKKQNTKKVPTTTDHFFFPHSLSQPSLILYIVYQLLTANIKKKLFILSQVKSWPIACDVFVWKRLPISILLFYFFLRLGCGYFFCIFKRLVVYHI